MDSNKIKLAKEDKDRERLKEKFNPKFGNTLKERISYLLLKNAYGKINDKRTRLKIISIISNYLNKSQKFVVDGGILKQISGFQITCDETNNTPIVIDKNELKFDILLKLSLSTITLNFVVAP